MIFVHCPTFLLLKDDLFVNSLKERFPNESLLECSFPRMNFDSITVRSGIEEYVLSDSDVLILECKSMSFWVNLIPKFKGLLLTLTFDNKHKTIRLRQVLKARLILKDFLNVYVPKEVKVEENKNIYTKTVRELLNFKVCYDCNNRLDYVLFLLSNCPITIQNTENGLIHFHGIKDFIENTIQISYKGGLASFNNLTVEQQEQLLNQTITIFNHE